GKFSQAPLAYRGWHEPACRSVFLHPSLCSRPSHRCWLSELEVRAPDCLSLLSIPSVAFFSYFANPACLDFSNPSIVVSVTSPCAPFPAIPAVCCLAPASLSPALLASAAFRKT